MTNSPDAADTHAVRTNPTVSAARLIINWTPRVEILNDRYLASGVAWRVGGGTTERQRRGRAIAGMTEAGLVTLHGAERRNSVKLTDAGEHRARTLCGLPSVADSWFLLRDVIVLCAIQPEHGPLCRELWLTVPPLENYGQHPEQEARLCCLQDYAAPDA